MNVDQLTIVATYDDLSGSFPQLRKGVHVHAESAVSNGKVTKQSIFEYCTTGNNTVANIEYSPLFDDNKELFIK